MHIYQKLDDGQIIPQHFVVNKAASEREQREVLRTATVTDFRKMLKEGKNVNPSVTSLLEIYNKYSLNEWQIKQHLKYLYLNGCDSHAGEWIDVEQEDNFIKWLSATRKQVKEELDKAPKAGTDFHKDMEKYIEGEIDATEDSLCYKVHKKIFQETGGIGIDFWQTEVNIFSDLGYSGQCDLFIPSETNWIIDYKTKQFSHQWKPKKMGYWDSHLTQLMAYGMELDPSCQFRCANVFVCLETGEIDFHEWTDENLKTKAWEYFQCALEAWKLKNL